MDEKIRNAVLELDAIKARKLIVWCAERAVPQDTQSPALDAMISASRYIGGRISYSQMRMYHDPAVRFYGSTHTRNRPWRGMMGAGEATNIALLAKLGTVADEHIIPAAEDAIGILYALEPFDEFLALLKEKIEEIKNDDN